jgi:hypothetical protein
MDDRTRKTKTRLTEVESLRRLADITRKSVRRLEQRCADANRDLEKPLRAVPKDAWLARFLAGMSKHGLSYDIETPVSRLFEQEPAWPTTTKSKPTTLTWDNVRQTAAELESERKRWQREWRGGWDFGFGFSHTVHSPPQTFHGGHPSIGNTYVRGFLRLDPVLSSEEIHKAHMANVALKNTVPDYFNPLLGYRQWTLGFENGHRVLKPLANQSYSWRPGVRSEASCHQTRRDTCSHCGVETVFHPAPQKQCHCGFYGFKDPVAFMRQLPRASQLARALQSQDSSVYGAVWLWGRVIEHRSGWRAQYAYPALICHRIQSVLDQLEASYPGVEIFQGSFADMISKNFTDPNPPEPEPPIVF